MKLKRILGSVAFVLLACMMLLILCDLFELPNKSNYDKRFETLRNLEDDTIDAVFIGTSGVDRYWIPPKAYEEYGMTLFNLSIDNMPTWLFTNVLDEAFKNQNPKLVLVDVRAFAQDNGDLEQRDSRARRVLDAMGMFSVNRLKAGFKTMRIMHDAFEDEQPRFDLSYLFSIAKYHDKWMDDDYTIKDNLGSKEHEYGGFYMGSKTITITPFETEPYDFDYYEPLDSFAEQSLYELIEYLDEKDVQVLFVDTPQIKDKSKIGRANTIFRILDEQGCNYINFLSLNQEDGLHTIDLDYESDFYNNSHVNYYGAEKFTAYFAEYLSENYDLPDRRNDEAVAKHWDGKYDAIKEEVAKLEEAAKVEEIAKLEEVIE